MPAPPGGAAGVAFADPNLSAADRQKLEDFRTCMEDNGAPGPPDPSKIDPSDGPPKPPSAADREKLQKAFEACKAKLPEKLQNAGPPGIGSFHCGPPPGAPPQQGQNQNQSNRVGHAVERLDLLTRLVHRQTTPNPYGVLSHPPANGPRRGPFARYSHACLPR